ncbi:MAG: nuclear transport factor 2 family protein [Edaphobacter sp.]|uniref:YybH family protein n=1 Tax=Edaphobacter sp. TaxID=1934404 RepID=UPI0023862658|nr:nuclear transport factor 2 family protein [Edaphobacter sp.]MDE1177030.1 nuclear transport factor 2 family protein [Edaphobacter sp.]
MRRFASLLPAVLIIALALPALQAQQKEQQLGTVPQQQLDVIKVLLAQEAAWNRGDLGAFSEAYKNAPDTLFITNTVNRGFDGLLESYRRDYPNRAAMGTLGFSELEVKPLDERFAVVIGRYTLERGKKDGGNATGLFSLVLEKTDKGWKIVIDHTT